MQIRVVAQTALKLELHAALCAREALLRHVDLRMRFQPALAHKFFVALVAREGFFSRVDQHVVL